jgi:hypothetical protein
MAVSFQIPSNPPFTLSDSVFKQTHKQAAEMCVIELKCIWYS